MTGNRRVCVRVAVTGAEIEQDVFTSPIPMCVTSVLSGVV
jgi:hypothetical protein